ncbi:kinase-like domain-containing protein, partial [Ochromonadaceae sp. CCMP2298]
FFEDARSYYILLEFAAQGELYKAVAKMGGKVSEQQCKVYIRDVAEAVRYLHDDKGVIHRDIKPENVLIGADGRLRLADFGTVAFMTGHAHTLGTQEIQGIRGTKGTQCSELHYTQCGTPEYLSPEMVSGVGHTRAVDLWAVGVMIFELLYGR